MGRPSGVGASFFVLLFIIAPAKADLRPRLDRRSTDLVLVERDQIPHDAIIESKSALVFRKRRRLRLEARDGVVAVLALADGIRELTAAPPPAAHAPPPPPHPPHPPHPALPPPPLHRPPPHA